MKVPSVLQDLFRDMRDKRLLPIAAVLVVGLIAVPVLLGGGASTPGSEAEADPDSAAAGGLTLDAPEARAVVVEQPQEIRNFRKRLDRFQRKNPFRQQLTGPSAAQSQELTDLDSGTDATTATGGGGGGGSTTESTVSGDGGGTSGDPGADDDGKRDNGGNSRPPERKILYSFEIDVKVGALGEAKKREGVKEFSFLPGNKRPVVQYVSSDFDGTEAFFVISRDVSDSDGDGACAPSKESCSFLLLKKGEAHTFVYEPDGRTYRLKLTKITRIEKRLKRAQARAEVGAAFEGLASTIRGE